MQFGVLAGNAQINARIYEMFADLRRADVMAFVRKFRAERNEQRFHTFRELIVGSQLRKQGIDARYEQDLLGKTPDWAIADNAGQINEIVDVVSLHQRRETESEMLGTLSMGEIWSGWVTIPPDHLYAKIEQKANAYATLVNAVAKPYTVFLFGEFTACVDPEEIEYVLYKHHGGAFSSLPTLAAVVYFFEAAGTYRYSYYPNSKATYPSLLLPHLRDGGGIAAREASST